MTSPTETPALARFQSLLRELFQFDSADLDFGIYRILNARRGMFEDWINTRLPAEVRKALSSGAVAQADAQAQRLAELAAKLREEQEDETVIDGDGRLREGITGKTAREYRELWQAQQAGAQPAGADARAADIYNRLYDFFRRYYEDGDFLSLRRYGADDAYAVPYNGQEVMLHWANRDQYYVKTGEHFTDYRFRAGDTADAWHVELRLRQAETDRDNTKSADKRHFFFDAGAVEIDAGARTLVLPVAWRAASAAEAAALPKQKPQDKINEDVERTLFGKQALKAEPALLAALKANVSEDADKPQTLLARHLRRYTRRNSSDFFIHKDLRGFLTRELDYWLKAEVLKLDTLLAGGEQPAQAWLQTLACLREVATTIIDFVARIEDFQKKLYEKRKFVAACHWCLTLDHVERAGLTEQLVEILNTSDGGKAQKAEWKRLFAIDDVKSEAGKPGWKEKVSAEFLRSQPYLVLDTVFMPQDFTDALLASLDDLDAATDGLLVHGDNWQALNLLMERYREQVQCVYIDPPYNTGGDGFLYRDGYRESNWASLLAERLRSAAQLMHRGGFHFSSIDDNEVHTIKLLEAQAFGSENFIGQLVVRTNPRGRLLDRHVALMHDYMLIFSNGNANRALHIGKTDAEISRDYPETDSQGRFRTLELRNTHREFGKHNRPNLYFPIYANPSTGAVALERTKQYSITIMPSWNDGYEGCWTWSETKVRRDSLHVVARLVSGSWKVFRKAYAHGADGEAASRKVKSILAEQEFSTDSGQQVIDDLFGSKAFRAPKPVALIAEAVALSTSDDDLALDYFAGSGTTAHAVIHLNREDGGRRKFLLAEQGDYFDTVLVPRVKKIAYSPDWKNGKPVSRAGSSLAFKYLRLESYEDTLSNLRLRADAPGQGGLDLDALPEVYRLGYWLDVETCGSASLLDVEQLERPFDYALSVHDGKAARTQSVDLAETFNYLIGLIVRQRRVLDRDGCRYLLYTGRTRADDAATAVLWRDIAGWNDADFAAERDWIASAAPFGEAAVVYVNGDSAIPGAQSLDPVFHARMFAPVH